MNLKDYVAMMDGSFGCRQAYRRKALGGATMTAEHNCAYMEGHYSALLDEALEKLKATTELLHEIQAVLNANDTSGWWMSMDKRIDGLKDG